MLESLLDDDRAGILTGDSAELGSILAANSIDSIVCDPPAGIAFMSRKWDKDKGGRNGWIAWLRDLMRPAYEALKPGAHGLVWALPRTSHWTATALEDCGFEIRDVHHHIFGTGFPKSLTSASAEIPEWSGTAFKPAVEHWILVRKPLAGTVGETFAEYGTGVLNIDGCRIGTSKAVPASAAKDRVGQLAKGDERGRTMNTPGFDPNVGRWPAHLTFEHTIACTDEQCVIGCPVRLLDEQSGTLTSGTLKSTHKIKDRVGQLAKGDERGRTFPDRAPSKGGASRFFYVAKGSRDEKDEGLEHLPEKTAAEITGREEGSAGLANPRAGTGRGGARNFHPTVKSVALMRWLVRLVTPPGGTVLDPFAGSGTTGVAALAEGCKFIGCEQGGDDGEYLPILVGRIQHALAKYPQ